MSNENQWIEQQLKEAGGRRFPTDKGGEVAIEDLNYEPGIVSQYEAEKGVPYIVDKLSIKEDFRIDPQIEILARGVDEFILNQINRDSSVSYETILERMLNKLPEPFERMMQGKKNIQILERLFSEVSINNSMSSKTYKEVLEESIKAQRVENLKQELKSKLSLI